MGITFLRPGFLVTAFCFCVLLSCKKGTVTAPTNSITYSTNFTLAKTTYNLNETVTIKFADTVNKVVFYSIDWGDGGKATQVVPPSISHAYSTAGSFTITVTISSLSIASTAKTIQVLPGSTGYQVKNNLLKNVQFLQEYSSGQQYLVTLVPNSISDTIFVKSTLSANSPILVDFPAYVGSWGSTSGYFELQPTIYAQQITIIQLNTTTPTSTGKTLGNL